MAYETWLKRKEWQEKKIRVLIRDNNKCQCSTCKTPHLLLEVHHIEYLSYDLKPWEYPDDMLISLCSGCHSKENTRTKSEESFFTCLKMKGFLRSDITALEAKLYSDNNFCAELLTSVRKFQR